jgi:hypothetical protein
MTTTVPQWPTNRLLLSALRLALLTCNLAVWISFSKPLFCISDPDQDPVGYEEKDRNFKRVTFLDLFFIYRYSTLLHLPPFIFHCVGGCRDRFQDCCDFGIDIQTLQPLGWISSTKHRSEPSLRHESESENSHKTGNILVSARCVSWSPAWKFTNTYLQYTVFFKTKIIFFIL